MRAAVAWVEEAFGPKASLLCGYFHWVSGATDNAIYPSLFLKYIASYMHSESFLSTDLVRFTFTVGITLVLSTINYSGLDIVGNLSILVCIISMSPFVIMVILAIPKLDPNRWMVLPDQDLLEDDDGTGLLTNPAFAGVHWRPLLNSLFWNLNSFDVGASFAGEVRDPEIVFPRAMFLSVIFVVFSYLFPLLAALGATDTNQRDWDAGYFTAVSVAIGGSWLGAYTVLASAISNIALFEAEMSGDAYQLMGMADRGLIPKWFTKRSRHGTPVNGIIIGTLVIILMSVADFDQLVEMLNFAYSLSFLMEFAAFVKLRVTDGDGASGVAFSWDGFARALFSRPPRTANLHNDAHAHLTLALTLHLFDGLRAISRSPLSNPAQYIRLRVLGHSAIHLSRVPDADCLENDLRVLRGPLLLWHHLSRISKGGQALQLGPVRGGAQTQQEKERRSISQHVQMTRLCLRLRMILILIITLSSVAC